jgi:hypothetical protein
MQYVKITTSAAFVGVHRNKQFFASPTVTEISFLCIQVPQFILEHCQSAGKACRIICTQPHRISAVSVSERVAAERNEKIGHSVGYQIRLECRCVLMLF